jgi:predicted phage-related endonuclease
MRWGNRLEPIVAQAYCDFTGNKIEKGQFVFKDVDGLPIGGTPDYLSSNDVPTVIEIKTAGRSAGWGDAGTDQIPAQYLTQVMHYMGLLGMPLAHVAALIGGNDFRVYNVAFDRELFSSMLDTARKFWQHVTSKTPPELDGSTECRVYLSQKYPTGGAGLIREPEPELATMVKQYRDAVADIAHYEAEKDLLSNQILKRIGTHDGIITDAGKLSVVRSTSSSKIDYKAVVSELNPPLELLAKHTETKSRSSYLKFTARKE